MILTVWLLLVGVAISVQEKKADGDLGPNYQSDAPLVRSKETDLTEYETYEPSFFFNIYNGLSSTVSTVYSSASTAKDHLYSSVSNITSEFAEKVRKIIGDEFFVLVMDSFTNVIHTNTAPGTRLHSVGVTTMTICLIFLCLFVSYILSFCFPILLILGLNCLIFLLQSFMGSVWVLQLIWGGVEKFYSIVLFIVNHYYLTATFLVILCIWSIYRGIIRLFYFESSSWQLNQIRQEVGAIKQEVHTLKVDIDKALQILKRIEAKT